MKQEHTRKTHFRTLLLLSILCVANAARAETALNTISLPGPVKLKVLWVAAAVGLVFIISRKQKRARNRL
jgi:hypothetical protein